MIEALSNFAKGFTGQHVSWLVRHKSRAYDLGFNTAGWMILASPIVLGFAAGFVVGRLG